MSTSIANPTPPRHYLLLIHHHYPSASDVSSNTAPAGLLTRDSRMRCPTPRIRTPRTSIETPSSTIPTARKHQ
ncbi:hypothetical protein Hypma_012087 [Hypsizygus marmoreus]|uniref:Uncharacterized protein n=1 Tax=Hypsizygus marmoreus TaxID=39966 RepID=A0A369JMY0_HYPMA|nr:hypothetical protein Hypma_012087 [Hypsizygus marmoreus]